MRIVRVGAVALNQTPLDWVGNRRRIEAAIEDARGNGVGILCLPELCITGYGCEDEFHSVSVQEHAMEVLLALRPHSKSMVISVGLPVAFRNGIYNCAALLWGETVVGLVPKQHLAGDGIHYEPRWFKAWEPGRVVWEELAFIATPMGDLRFEFGDVTVGYEICEDAWVADRPGIALARDGVDIILNPSASHFAFGKVDTRKRFVIEGSRAFGCTYVYANLLGNEAGRVIYDGGVLIASGGQMIAEGPRFSFRDHELTFADVDVHRTRTIQSRTASFTPNLDHNEDQWIQTSSVGDAGSSVAGPKQEMAAWEHGEERKLQEFTRAEALGLFDYIRKSGSGGAVVSLSGGADSSACAVLLAKMVDIGCAQLGREAFVERILPKRWRAPAGTNQEIVCALLTCVYQGTSNSSEITLRAARLVAEEIGAKFIHFDVQPMVEEYIKAVEPALGRPLSWETDDIALQNIQARVRAPGVWLIANVERKLLITTSNRSEAAVGYCTMDGDTAGSVALVAGIDKAFLRRWLRWIEREPSNPSSADDFTKVASLVVVNAQVPTAELRPSSQSQTDESDLMPYKLLDMIERAAILDKKSPVEILQTLLARGADYYPVPALAGWIRKFFQLWVRNQWKRERIALSFHLDDENLDPRSWCRFPILSGGFETELAEMDAYVATEVESVKSAT